MKVTWILYIVFLTKKPTATIHTLSLHDALPICPACSELRWAYCNHKATYFASYLTGGDCVPDDQNTWPYGYSMPIAVDRKSGSAGMPRPISYAVFCLKKKTQVHLCKSTGPERRF